MLFPSLLGSKNAQKKKLSIKRIACVFNRNFFTAQCFRLQAFLDRAQSCRESWQQRSTDARRWKEERIHCPALKFVRNWLKLYRP